MTESEALRNERDDAKRAALIADRRAGRAEHALKVAHQTITNQKLQLAELSERAGIARREIETLTRARDEALSEIAAIRRSSSNYPRDK